MNGELDVDEGRARRLFLRNDDKGDLARRISDAAGERLDQLIEW